MAKGIYSKLATNVPYEEPSVVTFQVHPKCNMATLASDWLTDFELLLKNSRTAKGIFSKLATNVPYEVPTNCCYFLSRSKMQYGCPGL